MSIQVLQEFYVNAVAKIAEPLTPEAARGRLAVLGRWHVHVPGVDDVIAATELSQAHTLSFWDAMIVRSAAALGCTVLWTEDCNPGQIIDPVVVTNPFT